MTDDPRNLQSEYMQFAKFGAEARFNLASSGVLGCDLADLQLHWNDLALHGANTGGYRPLVELVARRFGVDPACVVMPGGGASFANHLALAALVAPGDEVLAETPSYELIADILGFLQADVRRCERRADEGWALSPDRVADALTPRTRVVASTNLHNPSSAPANDAAVAAIAAAAARVGAVLFVDEAYRELTFGDGPARTAFREDGNVVVTSSLTKAYGLTGLRCGWILAPKALAQRMRRLNDLYAVHPPHVAERMAVKAFERLPALRARASALLDANRAAYAELLGGHPKLDQTLFGVGTTVFPRLAHGEDGEAFFRRLVRDFDTSLVPGRYFGAPDHVRIGLGGEIAATRVGLQRVAQALDRA